MRTKKGVHVEIYLFFLLSYLIFIHLHSLSPVGDLSMLYTHCLLWDSMKYWKTRRAPDIVATTAAHLTYTRESPGIYSCVTLPKFATGEGGPRGFHLHSCRKDKRVLIKLYCSLDVVTIYWTRHVWRRRKKRGVDSKIVLPAAAAANQKRDTYRPWQSFGSRDSKGAPRGSAIY